MKPLEPLIFDRFTFDWGRKTYVMGILNVTPDSFSDGGDFLAWERAIVQAQSMVDGGADIIDIGGQSTRPGAEIVSLAQELDRVIPVIEALAPNLDVPISVDTTRAEVARQAVKAGATIVNDISGGMADPFMLNTVALLDVPLILMHSRGTPQTMQSLTHYDDVLKTIYDFLADRIEAAIAVGITPEKLIIDPGIGFAKTLEQNLEIIKNLTYFTGLRRPLLMGVSRKSFIGTILNQPEPKERIWGTAAACVKCIAQGTDIIRVHDVEAMAQVAKMADQLWRSPHLTTQVSQPQPTASGNSSEL